MFQMLVPLAGLYIVTRPSLYDLGPAPAVDYTASLDKPQAPKGYK